MGARVVIPSLLAMSSLVRVPGPPIVGNALRLLTDPLGFTQRAARRHGDLIDLNIPLMPTYLVSHPDLIEQVLVRDAKRYIKDRTTRDLGEVLGDSLLTSEGDPWRKRRRLIQPGFHRERVASYAATMVACTERMLAGWSSGQVRDVHADMMLLTREIAVKTLFSADIAGEAFVLGEALATLIQRFSDIPPGVPLLRRVPSAGKRRFDRALQTLDDFIYRLIRERRARREDTGDLLSMLIEARDETGFQLDDRQLRDEAMTLFIAGHETTANALTWTFMLLAQHPAARERMERALEDALAKHAPTQNDLPALRPVEHTILESMRLFPPVWAIGRQALVETTIGDHTIAPDTQIWVSQYIVQRDGRWFEDPASFMPSRWENDLQKKLPRFAYFPFGGGPRICVGNTFAMMEATLVLATIAQRFRIELVPGQRLVPDAAITLRPREGLKGVLARR